MFPFAFLFAGGHGGFGGNATGNYTLDSNFTEIPDGEAGLNRAIEQYVGAYALNTLGKTQKVFSRKNKATSLLAWKNPSSGKIIDVYVSIQCKSMIAYDEIEIYITSLIFFFSKRRILLIKILI